MARREYSITSRAVIDTPDVPVPDAGFWKLYRKPDDSLVILDESGSETIVSPVGTATPIVQQFSGQFLLDPNEINGWGHQGFVDNSNTQDLGNVGSVNLSRVSGGFVFPFDVRITRFFAYHSNSNGAAEPWGWVISRENKTPGSNTTSSTFMLDESFDRGAGQFGLRNYSNTQNQLTDITSFVNDVIPAGEVVTVAVGAPTANTTNYYVRVQSGYIEFERV